MYEEILPLSEVKNHLRLETDFDDDDAALERMVASALEFIQQRTSHVFRPVERTYRRRCDAEYIDIFDYPVTYIGDLTRLDYADKVRFKADDVTVTVGYASRMDVPSALIDAALMIIENWYYGSEKRPDTQTIPQAAIMILNTYRRFTVC